MKSRYVSFLCLAAPLISLSVFAANQGMGPEEIILKSTIDPSRNPRLAYFPHAMHQETYFCSTCHHTRDEDGRKILYKTGMEIQKCEACHNKAAIKSDGMPRKYTPFMNVAHIRCKGCHRKLDKGPITCKGCHREEINK